MQIEEKRIMTIDIPVSEYGFSDNKEIGELFSYIYEKSDLYKNAHFSNTFEVTHQNGERVFKFTLLLNADDENYDSRKTDLEKLVDDYKFVEHQYLRFKKFGDIEAKSIIRKR